MLSDVVSGEHVFDQYKRICVFACTNMHTYARIVCQRVSACVSVCTTLSWMHPPFHSVKVRVKPEMTADSVHMVVLRSHDCCYFFAKEILSLFLSACWECLVHAGNCMSECFLDLDCLCFLSCLPFLVLFLFLCMIKVIVYLIYLLW